MVSNSRLGATKAAGLNGSLAVDRQAQPFTVFVFEEVFGPGDVGGGRPKLSPESYPR